MAQTPDPDWRKSFLILCEDICGSCEEDPDSAAEGGGNAVCPYCGREFEEYKPATDKREHRMCWYCRRRLIKNEKQLQRLVRETEKNTASLFGIELSSGLTAKNLFYKKRGEKTNKPASAGLLAGFKITDQGEAEIYLREGPPDAVIAAEVVRYTCESFLKKTYSEWAGTAGAAQWMKIRYLRILDLNRYADAEEKRLCKEENGEYGYTFWCEILNKASDGRTPHIRHIAPAIQAEWAKAEKSEKKNDEEPGEADTKKFLSEPLTEEEDMTDPADYLDSPETPSAPSRLQDGTN